MERKDENKAIALFAEIAQDDLVDSANLDILEEFVDIAKTDVKIKGYDPVLFAIVLATRLTPKCIKHWDNNDDAEVAM